MDTYYRNISSFASTLTERGVRFLNLGKKSKVDCVVIVGMGGSGLPGEVLRGVREELGLRIPVIVVKDYKIPKIPFSRPLYVFISFSGETEEVLSAFRAVPRGTPRAVVAGGGTLLRLAEKEKVPLAKFEQGSYVPRQATGLMFYGLAGILQRLLSGVRVRGYAEVIDAHYFENRGRALAKLLEGKAILVYSNKADEFIAYNWKIRFNENAKIPCFYGVLPEIDHNEIAGFQSRKVSQNFFAVFLGDVSTETDRMRKRMHLTKEVLKKYGVRSAQIELLGRTKLEKAWNAILYAEWASYFLAKRIGIDPFDTELIEEFKKMMRS